MLDELERAIADLQSLSYAIDTFNDKPGWYARGSIRNAQENLEDAFEAFSTGHKVRHVYPEV
jgi:hypothetical protein